MLAHPPVSARPALLLALLLGYGGVLGCGAPASPLPPSLNLPDPVQDLSAVRVGNSVHLSWTTPLRTTDKVLLRNPIAVQVCRSVQDAACLPIADLNLPPGKPAMYTDDLPADLLQADRLLRYEVVLQNRAGKSAGPSNVAYSAAGTSPPAVSGLTCQTRTDGVLLSWLPTPEPGRSVTYRIERTDLTPAPVQQHARSPLAAPLPPVLQTLAVRMADGDDPGHAIDTSAQFNQQYRYRMVRVVTPNLAGREVELQGAPSNDVQVTTTDTFPPAVPQDLVAVADEAAGAIDLSWSPDRESDLVAYNVYRRDTQAGSPVERIASLPAQTAYHDTTVHPGHTYAYALSAIDQAHNESQRSPEVQETLSAR